MCVTIMIDDGPTVNVPLGVPQGSVLGSFLFAAYMGSVNFTGDNIECIKFADDVTIVETVLCQRVSSISLDSCESVFRNKGLTVNRGNCKQLRIRRSAPCTCSIQSPVSNFIVCDSVKILGVTFDNRFK